MEVPILFLWARGFFRLQVTTIPQRQGFQTEKRKSIAWGGGYSFSAACSYTCLPPYGGLLREFQGDCPNRWDVIYPPPQGKTLGNNSPRVLLCSFFAGVLRGNTIRGNTTRNSERKMGSERVSERAFEKPLKTSENLSKPLKTSENLWKPLKTSETLPLRDPLRDPLRGRFPSQNLSVLLPLIVLPLETPTIFCGGQLRQNYGITKN